MLFGEYRFHAILEDEALLPPYKGSTFRGVFGVALKQVVCALKRQECSTCLLNRQCLYPQIFEFLPDLHPQSAPPPPHPFVIEPPRDSRTRLAPGEPFEFTLLLFGTANQSLPYFVYAFQEMGRIGIGKRTQGRRARFHLDTVSSPGVGVVYAAATGALTPVEVGELRLGEPPAAPVPRLTLSLLTPLRLKFQNRLQAELPFHVLVRAALRRLSSLMNHFGGGEPPLDYRGLIARAQEVRVARAALHWFDWQRYSNRQESAMLMGGLVGEVTYAGRLAEFLPLLRFVEQVHLGKATTFGLGQVQVWQAP